MVVNVTSRKFSFAFAPDVVGSLEYSRKEGMETLICSNYGGKR